MSTYLNHSAAYQQDFAPQTSSGQPITSTFGGVQELVPSRYALRVGDIDVVVISDGVLPLPTSTMSTNADPAARAAWFKDMYLGPDAFDWALNVLVIRSGEQIILVDAGLGGQFPGFRVPGNCPSACKPLALILAR